MKHKRLLIFVGLALLLLVLHTLWSRRAPGAGHSLLYTLQAFANERLFVASLLYLVFTAAACVLLALPGVTFAVIAGTLFGPLLGSLLCLAGTTAGAVLSFLAGRYFLQDSLRPLAMKNNYLRRVLFSGRDENAIVLLAVTRLLPFFPYNLQNFAYGITDIGLVKYTLCTFAFMAPGVCFFTCAAAGLLSRSHAGYLGTAVSGVILVGVGLWAGTMYRKKYEKG